MRATTAGQSAGAVRRGAGVSTGSEVEVCACKASASLPSTWLMFNFKGNLRVGVKHQQRSCCIAAGSPSSKYHSYLTALYPSVKVSREFLDFARPSTRRKGPCRCCDETAGGSKLRIPRTTQGCRPLSAGFNERKEGCEGCTRRTYDCK